MAAAAFGGKSATSATRTYVDTACNMRVGFDVPGMAERARFAGLDRSAHSAATAARASFAIALFAACSNTPDGAIVAEVPRVTDAAVTLGPAVPFAHAPDASSPHVVDASSPSDATTDAGVDAERTAIAPPPTTGSFLRVADWTPDAPSAGIDVCLAPASTPSAASTAAWEGPLLAQRFPPGSLGQGGPNGIQFPGVTQYIEVEPGAYQLTVVEPGATDCSAGLVAATNLPALGPGAHTTVAVIGDQRPTAFDARMKIAVFFDEVTPATEAATVRAINAVPSLAYLSFGAGSHATEDLATLFPAVGFGLAGTNLADGGSAGLTGYTTVPAGSGRIFSAQATGTPYVDVATATNVDLEPGSVTTFAIINGESGGFPPQVLVCADDGTVQDEQTPCQVFVH
jgi:hypothetical protein